MRKIRRYAARADLVHRPRQNLAQRISQYISVQRACSALTSGLSVWPEFGGDGAPIQLTPRSGNLPHSRPT